MEESNPTDSGLSYRSNKLDLWLKKKEEKEKKLTIQRFTYLIKGGFNAFMNHFLRLL